MKLREENLLSHTRSALNLSLFAISEEGMDGLHTAWRQTLADT